VLIWSPRRSNGRTGWKTGLMQKRGTDSNTVFDYNE
jgi:hypothetical protein